MEPDFDKIVSNKIRQTELSPVQWNKENVWLAVKSKTDAKRSYYSIYFAAAAIILLLIYFDSGVAPTHPDPPKITSKVKPTQEETASRHTSEKREPLGNAIADKTEAAATVSTRGHHNRVVEKLAPIEETTNELRPVIEPVTTVVESEKEEPQLTQEVAKQEEKIRPVVGVIVHPYPEPVASAKRKKRLRKLQSEDPAPWVDPGNAFVFAMQK